MVHYFGTLDLVQQCEINNWIASHIPGAREAPHLWQGGALNAHAATLVIAHHQQRYIEQLPAYPRHLTKNNPEVQAFILREAWTLQSTVSHKSLSRIDVDKECLALLEERMFQCTFWTQKGGYQQWGLDAGDHQEAWDPYNELPNHWIDGHYIPQDLDNELQVCIDSNSLP
jgi:hypothetical protein